MDNSKMTKAEAGRLGSLKRSENIRKKYDENPKCCKYCNSPIVFKKRFSNEFCTQSCAAKQNNSKRKLVYKKIICQNCNCEFVDKKNNLNRKFCSNKCQQEFQRNEKLLLWKKGELKTTKGDYQISTIIRNYLFEKFNNKCTQCGWNKINPITGKCPLDVEHIDGNSKNNVESNLTLLCPNCHSLTSTYKSLNKGHGRNQRMNRYREGKTF